MWGFRLSEEQKKYVKEKLNIDTDTDGIWSWSYNYNEDKTLNKEKPYRLTENGMVKATYGERVYWDIFAIDPKSTFNKYDPPSGWWSYCVEIKSKDENVYSAIYEPTQNVDKAIDLFNRLREQHKDNKKVIVMLNQINVGL